MRAYFAIFDLRASGEAGKGEVKLCSMERST